MEPKQTEKIVTKRKSKEEWKKEHKGKRLDGMNLNLVASDRPGWHSRFVTDTPQRIAQMERMGYQLAENKDGQICEAIEGTTLGAPLGMTREGPNTMGILMETPIENYQALQELKQEVIDDRESEMKAGHHKESHGDGRYVPVGGITIGRK